MNRHLGISGTLLVLALFVIPSATEAASSGVGEPQVTGLGLWSGGFPHARGGGVVLEHRRTRTNRYTGRPESYVILKGGGLRVGEDPVTDGLFLGFEVGGVVENVLEIGFTTDYFYRSSESIQFSSESRYQDLPVELVAFERTSAHLVPLGLTMRLVLPFAGEVLRPFISGTVAYEMLFLQNAAAFDPDDPVLGWMARDETFTGFGWQAAAGLRLGVSRSVGLFGEAGYHDSSPAQRYEMYGVPVDLKVNLSGPFLRGGLRFRL